MADLIEDVRTFLIGTVGGVTAERVHWNHVPEAYQGPYVYFGRIGSDTPDDEQALEVPAAPPRYAYRELFAVEAISDTSSDCDTMSQLLRQADSYKGPIGDGVSQGVFVGTASDDYDPRGLGNDDGLHVSIATLEVVGFE